MVQKINRTSAGTLLDETFNQNYDATRFQNFIQELFNGFKTVPSTRPGSGIYADYIEEYTVLGEYKDPEKYKIDVLSVKLKRKSSRDRARTMQRNFIAKHLTESNKDAALVAFYGDDPDDWRFSFVKMEYELNAGAAIVKTATPVKRYSYLVGKHEPNYTCKSQFVNLLTEDTKNPSLEQLEAAFSIEKVTKEFFEKYKQLFLELKENIDSVLEKDKAIKADFEGKEISTIDFAKKLLGQIVFIYFLQKKGWLGVGRNEEWGTGSKSFLRDLFEAKIIPYNNFFNDILQPLFYKALATENDEHYYERFDCKIPFLNGGLFEPMNNYNWKKTELLIENSIFKKILETFDEFNFTVKEDEPLEKEVAVDPEMLGKVFENLLDVKDRKSKGAFYTPREIVHYMCQQSLINYLETNTKEIGVSREDIEIFMHFSEFSSSDDQKLLIEIAERDEKIKSGDLKNLGKLKKELVERIEKINLPKSILINKERIDSLLANIKVVDPAVGSGAFPVGMMNEIIKARSVLSIFISNNDKETRKTLYDLKRETIENCLYGVDIDSSAVDITKLRFWLSLIVDENDINSIKPLPNLDHKIMCGNSLLEEFEGVKLFDEKVLAKPETTPNLEIRQIDSKIEDLNQQLHDIHTGKIKDFSKLETVKKEISKLEKQKKKIQLSPGQITQQIGLNNLDMIESYRISESKRKIRDLKKLHKKYFDENNKAIKDKLIKQIDELEWGLIEETLKESGNADSILKLKQYKKTKSKPFFLWKLYFADVFERENPGFDVVIANPPYVDSETMVKDDPVLRAKYTQLFITAKGNWDLFVIFIEKGISLLRRHGAISYIVPNKLVGAKYTVTLKNYMLEKSIKEIRDYSRVDVFKEADVYPTVFVMKNVFDNSNPTKMVMMKSIQTVQFKRTIPHQLFHEDVYWDRFFVEDERIFNIILKMSSYPKLGTKFQNITGAATVNEAYKLREFVQEYNHSSDFQFKKLINTGTIDPYISLWNYKSTTYIKGKFDAPIIRDSDIELVSSNRLNQAKSSKIIIAGMCKRLESLLDIKGEYLAGKSTTIILDENNSSLHFLNCLLNSKLISIWYSTYYKSMAMAGGFLTIGNSEIKSIPLNLPPKSIENKFVFLGEQITDLVGKNNYFENPGAQAKVQALQKEIDQLVYQLYELTPEEIEIVENFNSNV